MEYNLIIIFLRLKKNKKTFMSMLKPAMKDLLAPMTARHCNQQCEKSGATGLDPQLHVCLPRPTPAI